MIRNNWKAIAVALLLGAALFAACGDDDSETTTTTEPQHFQLSTPEGQVSVSLDGKLPPNWPTSFPIPPEATPAGSGSLGGQANTALGAVYKATGTPEATFAFYQANPTLKVADVTTLGTGTSFVGSLRMTEPPYVGRIVVMSRDNVTYIGALLNASGTAGSTTSTSTGSTTVAY